MDREVEVARYRAMPPEALAGLIAETRRMYAALGDMWADMELARALQESTPGPAQDSP